ncbi:MAG: LytTR family DNA-binding domain-containing protein [Pseudomonadota bacterium]
MDTSSERINAKISAMIVEDEPLARQGLMLKLKDVSTIQVVSACASALDAKYLVQEQAPDVIFLDVEMPGMSGLQFVAWMQDNMPSLPLIIFVTAYKEFALNAFEFEAFDYLLKPFADDRFNNCIIRLERHFDAIKKLSEHEQLDSILQRKTGNNIGGLMDRLDRSDTNSLDQLDQTISLKSGTEWLRIQLSSINWIEAAGDYMCVHTQDGTHIIRKTLKQFEADLNPNTFARVNRSAILNVHKLTKLTPNSNGEYIAQLTSGDTVKVTRNYKHLLDELS